MDRGSLTPPELEDSAGDPRARWEALDLGSLGQSALRGLFTHLDIKCLRLEGPAIGTKRRIQSYLETFSRVNKNNHFNCIANKSLSNKKGKGKVMLFFPLPSKGYNNIFFEPMREQPADSSLVTISMCPCGKYLAVTKQELGDSLVTLLGDLGLVWAVTEYSCGLQT